MKNIKIYIAILFTIVVVVSCSDETLNEIDTNKNIVTDAPLSSLLPQVIISYSNEILGSGSSIKAGIMSEQTTAVLGVNGYNNFENEGSTSWTSAYLVLNDLNFMKQKATEKEAWAYVGVGDVIKAFTLTTLIDLFGDIPYSESLQAEIRSPKFDSHAELYLEVHKILDEAIVNLKKTDSPLDPSDDDLAFGGDKTMWVKTAHALKARLYNKLSNLDQTGSAENALNALDNAFGSPDENFSISIYIDSQSNGNPQSIRQKSQPQSAIGNGIFNAMLSFTPNNIIEEDPRAVVWFTTVNGVRVAAPNGVAASDFTEPRMDGAIYSKPEFLKFSAAPLPMLTYNELLFIKAEANLRLGNTEIAYEAYQDAVELSLKQAADFNPDIQMDAADITNYMAGALVSPGKDDLTMENIILQKYISFFSFQWVEAYNETRKHDYVTATNPFGRANRMLYPVSEITRNPNTPSEVNFFSIFENSTKLIWAK